MDPGFLLLRFLRTPAPSRMRRFTFRRRLNWAEYGRVRQGLVPRSTKDKWLVDGRGGTVSFYRSGNGTLVYRVRFKYRDGEFRAAEALVNDDPLQITPLPESYEALFLDYLLDTLLLERKRHFPVPAGTAPEEVHLLERIWMGPAGAGS